jgi:hypothetical protein
MLAWQHEQRESDMPVNSVEVRRLVDEAIANATFDGSCCGRIERAFRDLQKRRQMPGGSLDLDLAAAEHHLFARWQVCTGHVSQEQMRGLVRGYDLKKRLDRLLGNPNAEAVTANPVSPPDDGVRDWGLRGVVEGEADRRRCNSGTRPPVWRSLDEVLGPGSGIGPY